MNTKLYYHKTDGGAEYLCTSPIDGTDEGDLSTVIIRLDGEPEFIRSLDDVIQALKDLSDDEQNYDDSYGYADQKNFD